MDVVQDILKKYKWAVLFTVILLVVWIVTSMITGNAKGQRKTVANQRAQLESTLRLSQEKQQDKQEELDSLDDASGLNTERVDADKKIMEGFFKQAFTFSDLEEYQKVRESVLADYLIASDSSFAKMFYPAVQNEDNKENLNTYQAVENGVYELSYESFTSHVVNIDGGEYMYVNDVLVQSHQKDYHVIVTCVIDEDGNLVTVQGSGVQK